MRCTVYGIHKGSPTQSPLYSLTVVDNLISTAFESSWLPGFRNTALHWWLVFFLKEKHVWTHRRRPSPGEKAAYFLSPAEALEWKHHRLYGGSRSHVPGLRVFTLHWLAFGSRTTERGNVRVWAGVGQKASLRHWGVPAWGTWSSTCAVSVGVITIGRYALCVGNTKELEKGENFTKPHQHILKNQCTSFRLLLKLEYMF